MQCSRVHREGNHKKAIQNPYIREDLMWIIGPHRDVKLNFFCNLAYICASRKLHVESGYFGWRPVRPDVAAGCCQLPG